MRTSDLCAFIRAREAVRLAKEAGKPREKWTKDPILATYRFCNVRRNDDRVSKWIHENWLHPWSVPWEQRGEDLWFAMVVARLFNLPTSLSAIQDFVLPFKPEPIRKALKKLRDKAAIFNGAYIVSTNGRSMDKVDYVIDVVLKPLWKDRARLRPSGTDTLDIWHVSLCQYQGLGSFMAAQVVADMKYVDPLRSANDWLWWAASGPGSRKGLGYVMHDDLDHSYNETVWRHEFFGLWKAVNKRLKWAEPLSGQDLQNCLCEYSKYVKVLTGVGKPKQLYRPHDEKGSSR